MTSSAQKNIFYMDGQVKVKGPALDLSLTFEGKNITIDVTELDPIALKIVVQSASKRIMLEKLANLLKGFRKTLFVSLKGEIAFVIGHGAKPSLLSRVGLFPGIEVKSIKTSAKLIRGSYNEF